jgi:ribosomal protein L7/L12
MVQIEDNVFEDIIRSLCVNNKVLAIKVVAKCLGLNLKESKEFIETL